jgi:WD40 repeat protein
MVATASKDKTVKLWSRRDGNLIATLQGHTDAVFGLSFSPDGKMLASASEDKTVILWNLDLDKLLAHGYSWLHDYLNNPIQIIRANRCINSSEHWHWSLAQDRRHSA